MENILKKTLADMGSVFTTDQFNRKSLQNGYSLVKRGSYSNRLKFIVRHCERYQTSRSWKKRSIPSAVLTPQPPAKSPTVQSSLFPPDVKKPKLTIKECIAYLKDNGYTITKLVSY